MYESSSDDEVDEISVLSPYMFEPLSMNDASATNSKAAIAELETGRRNQAASEWCSCHHCIVMETDRECRCCSEVKQIREKCTEAAGDMVSPCITKHPGFDAVALNPWVLQAAYNGYRQQYGDMQQHAVHKRYRYTAYRNVVRWCWGYIGKEVRVILPACVVVAVRSKFPSETYAGFKLPKL